MNSLEEKIDRLEKRLVMRLEKIEAFLFQAAVPTMYTVEIFFAKDDIVVVVKDTTLRTGFVLKNLLGKIVSVEKSAAEPTMYTVELASGQQFTLTFDEIALAPKEEKEKWVVEKHAHQFYFGCIVAKVDEIWKKNVGQVIELTFENGLPTVCYFRTFEGLTYVNLVADLIVASEEDRNHYKKQCLALCVSKIDALFSVLSPTEQNNARKLILAEPKMGKMDFVEQSFFVPFCVNDIVRVIINGCAYNGMLGKIVNCDTKKWTVQMSDGVQLDCFHNEIIKV